MTSLIRRLRADRSAAAVEAARSLPLDSLSGLFGFAGNSYALGLNTTYRPNPSQPVGVGLQAFVAAAMSSPPAFGAQLVRSLVLSQARFTFRRRRGGPGDTFGTDALSILEQPWPKGTTGELLSAWEWHEGLAGNAFAYRDRARRRLKVLRPDWVTIVSGSQLAPDDPEGQLDAEVIGYLYTPGGPLRGHTRTETLLPEHVAHWAPLPDPLVPERGMSWLTPVVREVETDRTATAHRIAYFERGATPNLVVTGLPAKDPGEFKKIVDLLEDQHAGIANAWRTLYLTQGADATVIGANLRDIDYKALQGGSETRISVASRVPAAVLGISEGLAGSSLNAGNYGMARRSFADGWLYPTLQSVSAALGQVVDVPSDAELWFDVRDMPFVREDAKDAADIERIKGGTIRQLVDAGFEPETVVAAVEGQDMKLLKHTGLYSVQLQPPGSDQQGNGGQAADDDTSEEDDDDQ